MNARVVERAAAELRRKRRRGFEAVGLGVVCGALAPLAWLLSPKLGVAVAVGGSTQAVLALWAFVSRRAQLEELALAPEAYVIPDVQAFGARLACPREREVLAQSIRSLLKDVFRPDNLYLPDRVVRYGRELDAIARDLLSPTVRVQPVAVAMCRWLLTHAAESPLYNPRLPAEDLGSWLYRIRAGMIQTR